MMIEIPKSVNVMTLEQERMMKSPIATLESRRGVVVDEIAQKVNEISTLDDLIRVKMNVLGM